MRRNILIEKGVLKLFMTDILSASQLEMARTGNGRRESFRKVVVITNPAGSSSARLWMAGKAALVDLPRDSITTLTWR